MTNQTKSKCCGAEYHTNRSEDLGQSEICTTYYICNKCDKACDVTNQTNNYIEEVLEKATEKITKYGYNDEYGYFNDWADGVRPIVLECIQQALLKQQEIIKECYDNSINFEGFFEKLKNCGINLE